MKFVIHHHVTAREHYDFMFEKGNVLETWQIAARDLPGFLQGFPVQTEKIQDHRREYLTFEGPISCDRGHVSIFDSGSYVMEYYDDDAITLIVKGGRLEGKIYIMRPLTNEARILYNDQNE